LNFLRLTARPGCGVVASLIFRAELIRARACHAIELTMTASVYIGLMNFVATCLASSDVNWVTDVSASDTLAETEAGLALAALRVGFLTHSQPAFVLAHVAAHADKAEP